MYLQLQFKRNALEVNFGINGKVDVFLVIVRVITVAN